MGYDIYLPKVGASGPGNAPNIPLESAGNPGLARFGQAVESAASTGTQWANIQNHVKAQNAANASIQAMMDVEDADAEAEAKAQADALANPEKLSTYATDHESKIKELFSKYAPKEMDAFTEKRWLQDQKSYLHQRRSQLRMSQTKMVVDQFNSSLKNLTSREESRMNAAPDMETLVGSMNDARRSEALDQLDTWLGYAEKNRIISPMQKEQTRQAVIASWGKAAFDRMLKLNPNVAGMEQRNGYALSTDQLRKSFLAPESHPMFGQMDVAAQNSLRDQYKAGIANVAIDEIHAGRANVKTVEVWHKDIQWDEKDIKRIRDAAVKEAERVHQAEEWQTAQTKREHQKKFEAVSPYLWKKIYIDRSATPDDLEVAEKAGIFIDHPEVLKEMYSAMASQHKEDQGVQAPETFGEYMDLKVKIMMNPDAADVQPDKWGAVNNSQKADLLETQRAWREKLANDPRLSSPTYKADFRSLVDRTGGDNLAYNTGANAPQMLQLRADVLQTYTLDVVGGMEPHKAFQKALKFIEDHPIQGSINTVPMRPGYVPPTVDEIVRKYPSVNDPRRTRLLLDRKKYDQAQAAALEQQKKPAEPPKTQWYSPLTDFFNKFNSDGE